MTKTEYKPYTRANAHDNFLSAADRAFASVCEVSNLIANGAPEYAVVDAFYELRNHIEDAICNWNWHFKGDNSTDARDFNDDRVIYREKIGDYKTRKEIHAARNAVRCLVPIAARIYGADAIPVADLMI